MVDFGLVLARLVHYAAATTLFGASLFPFYAYAGTAQSSGGWSSTLHLWTAVVVLISGLFWFVFSVANMAGGLSHLTDPDTLLMVVRETGFGVVWAARMLLAAITIAVIGARDSFNATGQRSLVLTVLAALLLVSLAGVGHTQVEEGSAGIVHMLSDAVHLLAAGAWLGGLVPLGALLALGAGSNRGSATINHVLVRFSGMGYVAVATLVATGCVNSWFLVGSVSNLLATPFGKTLLAKLALFAGMLLLAVANRFWLVPALSRSYLGAADDTSALWLRKLRIHVVCEQVLGMVLLLAVSLLGTMQPAISQ